MSLQIINWFNPEKDHTAKTLIVAFWETGDRYEDVAQKFVDIGYYVPEDQFELVMKLLNNQVDLDIGKRQVEYKSPAELKDSGVEN
jgi:hypothetical protein